MKLLHLTESTDINLGTDAAKAEELKYNARKLVESKGGVLIPVIEAIHSSVTRNRTFYGSNRLKGKPDFVQKETGQLRPSGVHSWMAPYPKPMLLNHDIDVDPLGRMTNAEFKNKTSSGVPGIVCYPHIVDPEAAVKVIDGRYRTVSIGCDVDAAYCSICNKNILEDWCDHRRGQMYEGKLCFWSAGNVWFAELSFVNAPSDEKAGVIEIPEMKESTGVEMGLLIQDLREHKLYDLNKDEVYAMTEKGISLIPRSEYMQEYYYIPFNIKIDESTEQEKETQGRTEDLKTEQKKDKEEVVDDKTVQGSEQTKETETVVENKDKDETETPAAAEATKEESETKPTEESNPVHDALVEQIRTIAISLGIVTETSAEDKKALEDKVQELQAENLALKNENESLARQLVEVKQGSIQTLVEKILDKKVELGDITESDKEAEKTRLLTRSEASLKDALEDLNSRKPVATRTVEKIVNPAQADNSQKGVTEKVITEEELEKKEPVAVEQISAKDVYKGLLTGKKPIQNKGRIK